MDIHTSAYVADVLTRYASGLNRFIRHHLIPDNAPPVTWDHPETLCDWCDACRSAFAVAGREKILEVYRTEAPMPGEPQPADKLTVPGVGSTP